MQAVAFLSRLPMPGFVFRSGTLPINKIVGVFPLAGIVLGVLASLILIVANQIGLPTFACAIITIASLSLFTGALHDDGLGDCADGFFGGDTVEKRLAIMKDSHIGTFAALTLFVFFLLKTALLTQIIDKTGVLSAAIAIIIIEAASRTAMIAFWYKVPPARSDGLSANIGAPADNSFWTAQWSGLLILAFGTIYLSGLTSFLIALIASMFVVFGFAQLSIKKIGGQTGDVLGACQQLTALTLLIVLASRI